MKTPFGTVPAFRRSIALLAALACAAFPALARAADGRSVLRTAGGPMTQYVRVSPRDSRYLELSDGTPYIPNGLNVRHPRLRVYVLKGNRTTLLWCRDVENTWQTELQQGRAPKELKDIAVRLDEVVSLAGRTARAYDPWKKVWTDAAIEGGAVRLPAFARSIVVRLATESATR